MLVSVIREEQLTAFLVEEQARFYRLAYSYLKNREEALDAVQAAVCRALEKQDSLREPSAMRAWFYHHFGQRVYRPAPAAEAGGLCVPDTLDAGSYEDPLPPGRYAGPAGGRLPVEVGTIIKLRFYEELSLREISAVTGLNLSTVKTRLYTGLKKLRISLEGANIE